MDEHWELLIVIFSCLLWLFFTESVNWWAGILRLLFGCYIHVGCTEVDNISSVIGCDLFFNVIHSYLHEQYSSGICKIFMRVKTLPWQNTLKRDEIRHSLWSGKIGSTLL